MAYDPGGALNTVIGLDPFLCPPLSKAHGRFYSPSSIRRTFLSAVSIWLILRHLVSRWWIISVSLLLSLSFSLPPSLSRFLLIIPCLPVLLSDIAVFLGHTACWINNLTCIRDILPFFVAGFALPPPLFNYLPRLDW